MTGFAMAGVDINKVYATRDFALGDEAVVGSNRYMFVLAAVAFAAGDALIADVAHADEPFALKPCTGLAQGLAGVAHMAIPLASFGWVTTKGKVAAAKVAVGTAADAALGTSATAGTLTTVTVAPAAGLSARAIDAEAAGLAEIFVG